MDAVILGSGNVATHLAKALVSAGHRVLQVWSRNLSHAQELAEKLNSAAISSFGQLSAEADIYILSVSDDAIPELAAAFPFGDKLLVHTSGTTGSEALNERSSSIGVFYPLQTFSKQRDLDFSVIPIAVEANSAEAEDLLIELARSISNKVVKFDSEQRKALHVAAVFACNFTNHFYAIADDLLRENGLNFDLIRPLIAETSLKAAQFSPFDVQTGPAVRNDELTINKHVKFLEERTELQVLYKLISQNIINLHQKA